MDNFSEPPPSNLLGNLEVDYKISDKPSIILRGSRKNVYHGIIDGDITETGVSLNYQKSYPRFKDFFDLEKKEEKE